MTKDQFADIMYVLFQVWEGTENADEILEDVCNTFGHRIFGLDGYGSLTVFRNACKGVIELPHEQT